MAMKKVAATTSAVHSATPIGPSNRSCASRWVRESRGFADRRNTIADTIRYSPSITTPASDADIVHFSHWNCSRICCVIWLWTTKLSDLAVRKIGAKSDAPTNIESISRVASRLPSRYPRARDVSITSGVIRATRVFADGSTGVRKTPVSRIVVLYQNGDDGLSRRMLRISRSARPDAVRTAPRPKMLKIGRAHV